MKVKTKIYTALFTLTFFAMASCQKDTGPSEKKSEGERMGAVSDVAPGAPGDQATWSYAGKTGIGTSYEAYVGGKFEANDKTGEVSKVWFSLADGMLTETMWGLIHEAQLKDLQVVLVGQGFVDFESKDTTHNQEYLYTDANGRPLSPAFRMVNSDKEGLYSIEKHVFTDPERQSLWQRTVVRSSADGIQPVLIVNPHIANTGSGDSGFLHDDGLSFEDGDSAMHVAFSVKPTRASVGFKGSSGAYADLSDGSLDWNYLTTGDVSGNVIGSAAFTRLNNQQDFTVDVVIGFGSTPEEAKLEAQSSLATGYEKVLANYNGDNPASDLVGWKQYIADLQHLPLIAQQATDGGQLAYASALVLKVQEDKTYAGALIASLSNPWGKTVSANTPATGYKAVWPRDFYQCAMAFLAVGDSTTAKTAFEYLDKIQVEAGKHGNSGAGGWFYQKAEVDGTPEWISVQLDQTGMPLMLGWQLWQQGHLNRDELERWYDELLRPAAEFLTVGGEVNFDWNKTKIVPPYTQQERWEEQDGYSPSTMAAVISGLISAAEMAKELGRSEDAIRYESTADDYVAMIDAATYTTRGVFPKSREYFLRVTKNNDPNDNGLLQDRNGRGQLNELEILDGGFLELVRYGVRSAGDEKVLNTIAVLDDLDLDTALQVRYEFRHADAEQEKDRIFSGWRRYGNDGYGEDTSSGAGYGAGGVPDQINGGMSAEQRGRVWPFLSGERGHYEIAAGKAPEYIRENYIAALEYFANGGLMLPEQVWDGVGHPTGRNYELGDGTSSATPLAWAHAEYLKLLRSNHDGQVFDRYVPVIERYSK